jgi:RNA polymerase sigma-70 factor (ECF subfamily)
LGPDCGDPARPVPVNLGTGKIVYLSVDGGGETANGVLRQFTDLTAVGGTERITAERFKEVVLANQRRIFRLLYSLVRDRDAADTLTQDCFLRAYRKWHTFRGEASVSTWLARIAVNLARDHGRNRRLGFWQKLLSRNTDERGDPNALEMPDPSPSAERVVLAREQLQSVWTAIEQLPPQQRTAFTLRFVGEMSLEEIADVMELEVGTVKAHLFRALSAVRKGVRRQEKP